MKRIVLGLVLSLFTFGMNAQVKTPQSSPKAVVNQLVGLTEVEIEYSRPSAKGRVVFGNLVPFGSTWRTGANANSTISFSEDVLIDNKTLKKGKYAIYTIPKVDSWEVIFYSKSDNWGNPEEWNDADVALRTSVKPEFLNRKVETFTIEINQLDNNFAHLNFIWENTLATVRFEVPTQKLAMASIDKALAGPTAGDYFSAAQYYFQSNSDMNKALEHCNKALNLNQDKPFWYLRLKSLIQAKLGDYKGAIEAAKLSLVAATKAKNNDYVKMNQDSILEWSKK